MSNIVVRKNRMFVIDKSQLKAKAKKDDVCNALYSAIYLEFAGASKNPRYQGMDAKSMLEAVNGFAFSWLKERGLV